MTEIQELQEPAKSVLLLVWNRIASGELEHNQNFYFCGTARCVSGWMCHYMLPAIRSSRDSGTWHAKIGAGSNVPAHYSPWLYCSHHLGVSEEDLDEIFQPNATLAEQYEWMLRHFPKEQVTKPESIA